MDQNKLFNKHDYISKNLVGDCSGTTDKYEKKTWVVLRGEKNLKLRVFHFDDLFCHFFNLKDWDSTLLVKCGVWGVQGDVTPLVEGPAIHFTGLFVPLWSPPGTQVSPVTPSSCNMCSGHI